MRQQQIFYNTGEIGIAHLTALGWIFKPRRGLNFDAAMLRFVANEIAAMNQAAKEIEVMK